MREFASCRDYRKFALSITRVSRYVFEPITEDFLKTVAETGRSRIHALLGGSILSRAQLGHDWDKHVIETDNGEGEEIDLPGPFSAERMKPLRGSAREGRVNPKGIPCLYLANQKNTAMAEVRPSLGSYISLAQFRTRTDLKLMNCSEPKRYCSYCAGGHCFTSGVFLI